VDRREARHEYGVTPLPRLGRKRYDAVVLAVAHEQFRKLGIRAIRALAKPRSVIYDIKHLFRRNQVDGRL
jgi:UDP-N-acetyl-D-galactosamine dehydrogenase